mmetsp:Transcript_2584/g.7688  ORF Transcript_2584/g.7688 Transcript_2584/m.7688 type:complete len:429 (-) Transcript_2584:23-1309(-)
MSQPGHAPEVPSDKDRARRPLYSQGTGSCTFVDQGIWTETGDGELVKYDMHRIGSAASLARLRGTVLGSSALWLHVVLYLAFAVMVGIAVGLLAERPDLVGASRVGEAVNYFCLFVSVSVAFHVTLAVERWWELRSKLLGELWRATNDLNMVLAVHFPSREHRRLKTLILRYCLLSFELMFMQARDGKADLHELCSRNLLRPDERERLEQLAFQPQVVWVWIAGTFQRLAEAGKLPSSLLVSIYEICTRARTSVGSIFAHLDTQLPFSYVHLISAAVHANNLLVSAKCGTMAAVAIRNLVQHPVASFAASAVAQDIATAMAATFTGAGGSGIGPSSIGENVQVLLLQCLQLLFVPLATVGLLEVAALVAEPFGSGFQDFPRSAYHIWLRDECEAFQTAAEEAPKELARVADVVEAKEPLLVHDVACAV